MFFQKIPHDLIYLRRFESVGKYIQICILPGMRQPAMLLLVFFHRPIQIAPANCLRIGGIQKYQAIRMGDLLPHGAHIRMFLGDMPGINPQAIQSFYESCFS